MDQLDGVDIVNVLGFRVVAEALVVARQAQDVVDSQCRGTQNVALNGDPVPPGGSAVNPLELPPISRIRGTRGYNELPAQLRELIEEAYSFHQKLSRFGGYGRGGWC